MQMEGDDQESALMEWLDSLNSDGAMSLDISDAPSDTPSSTPTTFTPLPTVSANPSVLPSISQAPTVAGPQPTQAPSNEPTGSPTSGPTQGTVTIVTAGPTLIPTMEPSSEPTLNPTESPTDSPTSTPTVDGCTVSAQVRVDNILALLRSVADPQAIASLGTAQGKATDWLLNEDPRKICPDNPKILQRWVLAVIYFSTGGDTWFQCSNNILANDDCGDVLPFEEKQRFLSGFSECDWAGIECNIQGCVDEIEFGKFGGSPT
jgi:hypothetical protein